MSGIHKPFYVKITNTDVHAAYRAGDRFLVVGTARHIDGADYLLATPTERSRQMMKLHIRDVEFDGFRGECLLCEHRPTEPGP